MMHARFGWTLVSIVLASPCLAGPSGPARVGPVVAFRSGDGLKVTTSDPLVQVMAAAAQPDVLLLPRATPSRNGPDAGAMLVYAAGEIGGSRGLIRSTSADQGRSWSVSERVVINGWPKELEGRTAAAPAAVQLDDGRVRLYFQVQPATTIPPSPPSVEPPDRRQLPPRRDIPRNSAAMPLAQVGGQPTVDPSRPAGRPGADKPELARIYSAISNDGLTFAFEDGIRFELAGCSHPEVIRVPDAKENVEDTRRIGPWLLFLTREDSTILAISRDGLTFERDPTFVVPSLRQCTAALMAADQRSVRLWGIDRTGLISVRFDPSTGDIKADSGVRIAVGDGDPTDPGVAPAGDGSFVLVCVRKTADKPGGPDRQPPRPEQPISPRPVPIVPTEPAPGRPRPSDPATRP